MSPQPRLKIKGKSNPKTMGHAKQYHNGTWLVTATAVAAAAELTMPPNTVVFAACTSIAHRQLKAQIPQGFIRLFMLDRWARSQHEILLAMRRWPQKSISQKHLTADAGSATKCSSQTVDCGHSQDIVVQKCS